MHSQEILDDTQLVVLSAVFLVAVFCFHLIAGAEERRPDSRFVAFNNWQGPELYSAAG